MTVTLRRLQVLAVLAVVSFPAAFVRAAAPPQIIGVCGSQPNQPTVYFSGVMQGPAAAWKDYQAAFNAYLAQHYAYKGVVGCAPAANVVQAQNAINTRATQLRNGKKIVIETGWTEGAAGGVPAAVAALVAPAAPAPAPAVPTAKAVPGAAVPAAKAASSAAAAPAAAAPAATSAFASGGASGSSGASELASILGSIFGTSSAQSAAAPAGAGGGQAKSGSASPAAGGSGSAGAGQSPFQQVSGSLSSAFASHPSSPAQAAAPVDGALGSAQWQTTKLVVYGCGRQDLQIACVTTLANQNQNDTLVQAGEVWKDAFIVDDRGDRHQRSNGFFLNVDGDQRPQLDISYGKTARFILMFDGVPAKVQKVALRSINGGMDVEDIGLIAAAPR
jgi:hypothetical protein